jgi:DNA-directed RNA polymerase subunit RPC12/RpoP
MGMKCVQCGTDNNLSDRTINGGRCKNCNHPFVFEPSAKMNNQLKFTDPFFAKVINDISANNTLYFTSKQLLYLLDRRLKARSYKYSEVVFLCIWFFFASIGFLTFGFGTLIVAMFAIIYTFLSIKNSKIPVKIRKFNAQFMPILGFVCLIVGIIISLNIGSFVVFAFSVIFGMGAIYLGYRQHNRILDIGQEFIIPDAKFQDWTSRWKSINGNPKMLPSPRMETSTTPIPTEISAYSFDRVIVCDNPAIAQMLIANNFHFENSCAILSISGYPQSIFSVVLDMLRRNPDLKVYALHDASPRGVTLVHNLRTSPNWFLDTNIAIYDLGLLPRQIFSSRGVFINKTESSARDAKQLPPEVKRDLTEAELQWLEAGNFVELESFSPQRIIRVVNQGIAKSQAPDSGDSLILIGSGDDSLGYIYAADTFG